MIDDRGKSNIESLKKKILRTVEKVIFSLLKFGKDAPILKKAGRVWFSTGIKKCAYEMKKKTQSLDLAVIISSLFLDPLVEFFAPIKMLTKVVVFNII